MAFFTGYTILRSLYNHHRPISSFYKNKTAAFHLALHWQPSFASRRWLSTGTESTHSEFAGANAYELLGVSETSSFAEIKSSFRKLAKETHPDVAQSHDHSSASKRFIQILAAYEILSDSEKRAHYDRYLLSQRTVIQRHPRQDYVMYNYELHRAAVKQMEVVEWLEWYRDAIKDILSDKRVVAGSGYFDVLERDFYSAIHAAYYGPAIESMDLLPDCFEAEERSDYGTSEVLHLVSGRDLFGMVCIPEKVPELSHGCKERLTSFGSCLCPTVANIGQQMNSGVYDFATSQSQVKTTDYQPSDAYKDLELYILGNRVAVATRVPPRNICNGIDEKDLEDQIHVYLTSPGDTVNSNQEIPGHTFSDGSRFHLGTITGLGTSPDEGSCTVYSNNAVKTHVIMKHRTLLVKHMHWYQVGDEVSVCECRCSRARLPPSKYWLFEPRCGMHDIGGWYVETFGRDKKGRTVPSQRFWDGLPTNEQYDKKLHPAVYLLALAYRTLDIEVARRRKQAIIKDIFEPKMFSILSWCKKLI